MYSAMTEMELEKYIDTKVDQGFIDPDFMTCMFIDGSKATMYDALEAPGQKTMKLYADDLASLISWFKEFDANGYLIASPEMEPEVREALRLAEASENQPANTH